MNPGLGIVTRLAAILAALALACALPAAAQQPTPVPAPPAGAVLVQAFQYDGMTWVPVRGAIGIPPIACNPT